MSRHASYKAIDDAPYMWKKGTSISMQCNKLNSDPTNDALYLSLFECWKRQADRYNSSKQPDEFLKPDWHINLVFSEVYSAFRDKFVNMLTEYEYVERNLRFYECGAAPNQTWWDR